MDALAAFKHDTFARQDLRNRNSGCNDSSRLPRGIAEVERDHPHTAFDIAPHPRHSAKPPRSMMKTNRCGPRVERTRIRANHPLSKVSRLQPFIAQIVFNEVSHRPVEEHPPCFFIATKPLINLFACRSLADPHISIACGTQSIARPANHIAHCAPALDIAGSKGSNLILTPLIVIPELNA